MSHYCTLAEAKVEIKGSVATSDNEVLRYIRQISQRVDNLMDRRRRRPFFEPYIEQRQFRVDPRNIDSWLNVFYLHDNLLSFTEVLLDTTDKTSVVEAYQQDESPYSALRFSNSSHYWYSEVTSGRIPVYVKVTGTWGFHRDYNNAWSSVDTLAANFSSGGSQITVADVDGEDEFGVTPRLSAGNLIRIGSEFLRVFDTDTDANTAGVKPAVNGSSAAAHSSGAEVEVWQTEEGIKHEVARQVGMWYARRGAFEVQTFDAIGIQQYPQDLALALRAVLSEYL
jgi:hypothetical protein